MDPRVALAGDRCWDRAAEDRFQEHGEALEDCILQNRDELLGLCAFIQERNVRSYLEIGVWTGRLVTALHRVFRFDRVAACDQGWAETCGLPIHLPGDALFYRGDSDSDGFLRFREALGPVDLVLVDGDHRYPAVRRDFEIQRAFPHRFLAFHDITGARPQTRGVGRFWRELDHGWKREIILPHRELGLEHSLMGIGIWSEREVP